MKRKIGFLTRRKYTGIKQLHRFILSWLIYKIQGKYVHCYLVYLDNNVQYVREMEQNGTKIILYSDYIKRFKDRINVEIDLPNNANKYYFDYKCKNDIVKYDYSSLFIKFPLLYLFDIIIKTCTINKRTCSEDCARMINILKPYFVKRVEYKTPQKLYEYLNKNINTLNNEYL